MEKVIILLQQFLKVIMSVLQELDNGNLGQEQIVSQEEFEKMVKQEGWIKQE